VTRLKAAFRLQDADVFIQERGMRYPAENLIAEAASLKAA
jgi:hypothetical protein